MDTLESIKASLIDVKWDKPIFDTRNFIILNGYRTSPSSSISWHLVVREKDSGTSIEVRLTKYSRKYDYHRHVDGVLDDIPSGEKGLERIRLGFQYFSDKLQEEIIMQLDELKEEMLRDSPFQIRGTYQ